MYVASREAGVPRAPVHPGITVQRLRNDDERAKIFELRYAVYVEEQGKSYSSADTTQRRFTDELDEAPNVEVLAALDCNTVVGTVRWNSLADDVAFARYRDDLELARFSTIPRARLGVCSRLAVHSEYRNATVRAALFDAIYDIGLRRRSDLCFATCAPRLLRLFRAYGFRRYTEPLWDPTVGKLERMVLHLQDLPYLQQIGSPFTERLLQFLAEHRHASA